jgi:hypothetical protein
LEEVGSNHRRPPKANGGTSPPTSAFQAAQWPPVLLAGLRDLLRVVSTSENPTNPPQATPRSGPGSQSGTIGAACLSGALGGNSIVLMIHLRIIGSVWVLFGATGALACIAEGFGLLREARFDGGAFASLLIALPFCLFAVATGLGLLRARRWATICVRVVAVLLLLYCLSFVLMSHFSFAWVGLFGVVFAAYSLYVVAKFKPDDHTV